MVRNYYEYEQKNNTKKKCHTRVNFRSEGLDLADTAQPRCIISFHSLAGYANDPAHRGKNNKNIVHIYVEIYLHDRYAFLLYIYTNIYEKPGSPTPHQRRAYFSR